MLLGYNILFCPRHWRILPSSRGTSYLRPQPPCLLVRANSACARTSVCRTRRPLTTWFCGREMAFLSNIPVSVFRKIAGVSGCAAVIVGAIASHGMRIAVLYPFRKVLAPVINSARQTVPLWLNGSSVAEQAWGRALQGGGLCDSLLCRHCDSVPNLFQVWFGCCLGEAGRGLSPTPPHPRLIHAMKI